MALIDIRDVCMAYGSPLRPVLEGIGLSIEEASSSAFWARPAAENPHSCAWSSVPKSRCAVVLVDGQVHEQPDRSRGYVPQKYSLFTDKTVLDNITFGSEVGEFSLLGRLTPRFYRRRREFRREALDYLRRIGLQESDAGKYPDQLSGGMQQRVAIAQALMTRPRILLMDEAFSPLDPGTRRGMQRLIREVWRSTGSTVLFVTHNTQEALSLGTRVIVLAKDTAEAPSRIALDMAVPEPCEEEVPRLVRRLERVATSSDPAGALSEKW